MRGCQDFNAFVDKVREFYAVAGIEKDDSGRYVQDGVYFPNANGKYEDFTHLYVTNNETVVIDKYSFDIIVKSLNSADKIVPDYVAQKYKYYSTAGALQSATEQQLAFTHKQMKEINEALMPKKMDAQREYEVAVLKQQMQEIQQKHLLDVQMLHQLHEQEVESLKQQARKAQKDFAIKHIAYEVDNELKHMGIEAFQELFGSDYSEDILK